jgi:adenylate cyclase
MVRDSRKIAAILAADVVDYSRLMGADEAGTLAALAIRRAIFDRLVREFDGRVFGSVGDSLMAEFTSAVHAVECARAVQDAVASENTGIAPGKQMRLRIGVNLGDVIEGKDGVAGDAVNVAARLQAIAKPGGVLISGTVYDQVHLKVPARYVDAGTRRVKNIEEPVRTFEVLPASEGALGRIRAVVSHLASQRSVRIASMISALLAVAAVGLFWRDIPVPATGRTLGEVVQPASSAPPGSIAVLPFINMTGDPAIDYLGDGLAEELIHRLSGVPGLLVAARRSAFAYRGKDAPVGEIADALGVAWIVEGSVRRQGNVMRVNAALVERGSGANRWSNTYESSGNFFAIQDDIGKQVLTALKLVLESSPFDASAAGKPGSIAAYDLFLQGLAYLRQPRSAKTLDAAEAFFGRALAEQPDFARAQAGLCEAYVERYALERVPARVTAAEGACARAHALDSSAQEVHEAIGRLRLATGDAAEAEAAYRRALAIVPSSPDALIGLAKALAASDNPDDAERTYKQAIAVQLRYGASHVAYGTFLYSRGRNTEAIAAYEQATILMPDNPDAFSNLGVGYFLSGDFERAGRALKRALEIEPRRGGYTNYGSLQYYQGRYAQAEELFRKALEFAPEDNRLWGNLADAMRFDGKPVQAREAYRRALELADGELAINPKHAVNQALAAYYAIQLEERERARDGIAAALAEGDGDPYVHYYVALTELGLGDTQKAATHVQRAQELGYPKAMLKAAPELGDLRKTF